jgi:carbon-monoxide dehydrogenase small subunit
MHVSLTVNGHPHAADVEPRTLLVDLLRDELGLTGTKVGCDTGQCGACVVMMDGQSIKSCCKLAVQAQDSDITTVEGLAHNGKLGTLQEGFWECHGTQCGFCTPGMLMSVTDLLQNDASPDEEAIRRQLEGNLCRCTGYQNVVKAVQYAVKKNNSPVKIIVDTPGKLFYENQVKCLLAGDADRLVDENYLPDATVQSFDWKVTGHEALRAHFRNYMRWVHIEEVLSTDNFTETDNTISFEATVRTNRGVGRVYDVFTLRNGKVAFHFTGTK